MRSGNGVRRERGKGAAIEGKRRGEGERRDRSQMVASKEEARVWLSEIRVLREAMPAFGKGGERKPAAEEKAGGRDEGGGGR